MAGTWINPLNDAQDAKGGKSVTVWSVGSDKLGLEDGLKNQTLGLALCTVILASGWLPSQGICAEFQGKGVL